MLIALLAILGVNLIVIVVVLAVVLSRKRWVSHQPGSFRGAVRVSGGEVDGFRPKWTRGYGCWVSNVLIWRKAPFLFRADFVAISGLKDQRPAHPDEVKRVGDHPSVTRFGVTDAAIEVAAADEAGQVVLGPYAQPSAAASPKAVV
jgi:hypothetical protein